MLRSDLLHLVGFVENDKVIAEQDSALDLFVQAAEQGEEQGVVEHQNVGRENAAAGALEKAKRVLLSKSRLVATYFRRTQTALGAHLRPDLRIRLEVEIGQAAVGGSFR